MSELLTELQATAFRMGGCDPKWLKNAAVPEFKTVEKDSQVSGQPELLLLHGLMGAISNWDAIQPIFDTYSHSIAFHFPILTGHSSEITVKSLGVLTEAFIRTRKLSPVSICGNSLGGHVAMRLALARPELIDCLVLAGTSGLYEHSVDSLPVRPDRKFIRDQMDRVFFNKSLINDEAVESLYSVLTKKSHVLSIIQSARSAKKDNLLTLLPHIKCPVLLLWGEEDKITTMDVAEKFKAHLPNAKLITKKGCGHAPMIEHPEWFSEEVHKFLQEHSRFYKKV